MSRLKLDFEGLSQAELKAYQENFVSTISKLKHGLFNAEAALGLNNSISILSDLHLQTSTYLREWQEKLSDINFNAEMINETE